MCWATTSLRALASTTSPLWITVRVTLMTSRCCCALPVPFPHWPACWQCWGSLPVAPRRQRAEAWRWRNTSPQPSLGSAFTTPYTYPQATCMACTPFWIAAISLASSRAWASPHPPPRLEEAELTSEETSSVRSPRIGSTHARNTVLVPEGIGDGDDQRLAVRPSLPSSEIGLVKRSQQQMIVTLSEVYDVKWCGR